MFYRGPDQDVLAVPVWGCIMGTAPLGRPMLHWARRF